MYGYLCRWLKIPFFWESQTVGWCLLLLTAFLYLLNRIDHRQALQKQVIGEKLGLAMIGFFALIISIVWVALAQSDAYAAAKRAIGRSLAVRQEIGSLQDVFIRPTGQLNIQSSAEGKSGQASLYLVAKGDKEFRDIRADLSKLPTDSAWVLRRINFL
ncbi:hypothetical protein F0P96_11985 [Hymenobacter busanensis]|uniref:Uncharacterized protein n=1 Tax=Hymenobacter busanensis TaxID=2607656 RepID=A0A7L4ZX98_9BACT|nr:hypothetical protein [Hymenobacter busanensis]KAA9332196.1 hypothetical protein F0P96_11985 [Hymenobacter busanensis]QHJ07466.1 hypothetical protein GUY19_09285 [Hymenobacter busanensis]